LAKDFVVTTLYTIQLLLSVTITVKQKMRSGAFFSSHFSCTVITDSQPQPCENTSTVPH